MSVSVSVNLLAILCPQGSPGSSKTNPPALRQAIALNGRGTGESESESEWESTAHDSQPLQTIVRVPSPGRKPAAKSESESEEEEEVKEIPTLNASINLQQQEKVSSLLGCEKIRSAFSDSEITSGNSKSKNLVIE